MRIRDVLRALLVLGGLVVVGVGVTGFASLPPPPPNGRDIPGGFALIFLGIAVLAGVFLVVGGLALTGDDDPVFHGGQRTALTFVGYLLAGSLVAGVAVLVTIDPLVGVAVPGLVALLLAPVVLLVLCWRIGEALVGLGRRVTAD
jgi:hypothetical protein